MIYLESLQENARRIANAALSQLSYIPKVNELLHLALFSGKSKWTTEAQNDH